MFHKEEQGRNSKAGRLLPAFFAVFLLGGFWLVTAFGAGLLVMFGLSSSAQSAERSASQQVIDVLRSQGEAWNKGDLDAFMTGYLQSPDTSFTSGGNVVWGYQALHDRYQKKYGKSRETMGKLKFSDLKTFELGPKNELVIGRWHLDLSASSLDGVFSLVFVKTKDGWKIMHDHTSLADKKPPVQASPADAQETEQKVEEEKPVQN